MNFIVILTLSCLINIPGREPYLCDCIKYLYHWLVFGHLQSNFSQTWYCDRDYYVLHFDTSLDELDLPSRSQVYDISQTTVPISLQFS